jgi:hypothetical protein
MTVSNGEEEDADERREDEMVVQPKIARVERNTPRKINYDQQLLDILKEKSEHTDEDKPFFVRKLTRSMGEDGNAGNYEKSKTCGVSATICTAVMKNDHSEFFYLFQIKL